MPVKEDKGMVKAKGKLKNKITATIVLLLILFVWLAIFAVLIKLNVGSFGTTVRPVLKDIPYINMILPEPSEAELAYDSEYPYKSLKDAMNKIEELEVANDKLSLELEEYKNTNSKLEEELKSLEELKKQSDTFNQRVLEFDRQVVLGDKALTAEEYKKFYESINPDNAEIIYRQVVGSLEEEKEIKEKAAIYSQMDKRAAARIFETLSTDPELLIDILSNMATADASGILGEMDPELAGKLTKELFNN